MRRLFSDKAGATFNESLPSVTVNVRKDCEELVSKVDKGVYAITNLVSAGNGQIRIIANWGRFPTVGIRGASPHFQAKNGTTKTSYRICKI